MSCSSGTSPASSSELEQHDLVPARELGPASAWAGRLTRVLRSVPYHVQYIATTDRVGDVAVHSAFVEGGLKGLFEVEGEMLILVAVARLG